MGSIGASWALAQTVDGFLKLSRDTVLAATSDNLQPLTIAACEKFGATLAVSQLARTKMEVILKKQSKAPAQKLLLLTIGYAKGGSVDILSSSAEGIRFLCFASALVSSRQIFDAANILSDMIHGTADDKDLSPTIYQLKHLLDILEPRLNKYGFLDEVHGYQTLITASTGLSIPEIVVPKSEAVKLIIESFCELSRLGHADARSIKFTAGRYAPWIAAFARLCVEVPPSIVHVNDRFIVEELKTQVTVCVSDDARYQEDVEMEVSYAYGSIHKIIKCVIGTDEKPDLATGMVSLSTHAQLLLRELEFDDGLGSRVLGQALPYAVYLIKSFYAREGESSAYDLAGHDIRLLSAVNPMDPFPHGHIIRELMKAYLKPSGSDASIKKLDAGLNITDLPLVKLWTALHRSLLEDKPEKMFIRRLSYVVADLFALALLMPNGLSDYSKVDLWLLYIPRRELSDMFSSGGQWRLNVETILQPSVSKRKSVVETNAVGPSIDWALKLLGHSATEQVEKNQWVATSFRGQVVLPRMAFVDEIPQEGFASLSYFPGSLMVETQKYKRFISMLSQESPYVRTDFADPGPLTACLSPFRDQKVRWHLTTRAGHLHLSLGWKLNKSAQPPMYALVALTRSVVMGRCGHPMEQTQHRQGTTTLLAPGSNRLLSNVADDVLAAVYPLYQKEELKFLALASTVHMSLSLHPQTPMTIINRGACINCLLDVCEIAQCRYIIL